MLLYAGCTYLGKIYEARNVRYHLYWSSREHLIVLHHLVPQLGACILFQSNLSDYWIVYVLLP